MTYDYGLPMSTVRRDSTAPNLFKTHLNGLKRAWLQPQSAIAQLENCCRKLFRIFHRKEGEKEISNSHEYFALFYGKIIGKMMRKTKSQQIPFMPRRSTMHMFNESFIRNWKTLNVPMLPFLAVAPLAHSKRCENIDMGDVRSLGKVTQLNSG